MQIYSLPLLKISPTLTMENDSLESLQLFLEDPIYLLPSDRLKLEEELRGDSFQNISKSMDSIEKVEIEPNSNETAKELEELKNLDTTPILVQGGFSKGILIVHEEVTLSPEVMDMLVKMLNACGYSMSEVGLVASANLASRSMEDFQNLNGHVVLKFGRIKHPIQQLPFSLYEIHVEGETEYLFADALTTIAEDKALKRKLWGALQLLFNLSS